MTLIKNYPQLFQFFGGYFAAYSPDYSDEDVLAFFTKDANKEEILEVVKALDDLKVKIDDFKDDIMIESNRYFKDESELENWILMIKENLKNKLELK